MEAVLEHIVRIARNFPIRKVVLFGSRARGDYTSTSDYDIAFFDKGALSPQDQAMICCDIDDIPTLKKIDVVFMDPGDQDELWTNVEREGVVVYEQV
jgi:predicted nucleotidyltransferase